MSGPEKTVLDPVVPHPPTAQIDTTTAQSENSKPSTQSNVRHQCQVCSKQYERVDHLKRHELSHENPRHHACPRCPRRFNRRDLLSRHLTTHDCASDGITVERAAQACVNCIVSKTKCGNQRPCYRCKSKGLSCFDNVTRKGDHPTNYGSIQDGIATDAEISSTDELDARKSQLGSAPISASENGSMPPPQLPNLGARNDRLGSALSANEPMQPPESGPTSILNTSIDLSGMFMNNLDLISLALPDDLFPLSQDGEFVFDGNLPGLYSELYLPNSSTHISPSSNSGFMELDDHNDQTEPADIARRRISTRARAAGYEAFKESPWLWILKKNYEPFNTRNNAMRLLESSPVASNSFLAPKILNVASRDELLSLALKNSTTSLKVRSFPSLNLLNLFVEAFFIRQNDSFDSWIHLATFDPDSCRSELLSGVVAAGSTSFAVPNVWKMGLALQEITRIAVCRSVDDDYGLIHNLQINQTFLIWIEVSVWSGFRRKMEIGESFSHTLPTMLRATGAFRQTHYLPESYPTSADEGELLKKKWIKWVEQESLKRLVLRCLINEMQCSIAFGHGPVWSGLEIGFFLPASRDLWNANNAEEWKEIYLSKTRRVVSLTLVDAMRDASRLEDERQIADISFCALCVLYGFWGRVWSFLESRKYTSGELGGPANLWVEAHRQELLDQIKSTTLKLEFMNALSPEARLISEFLLMSLYTYSDETRRLASLCGDKEARRVFPRFRGWTRDEDRYYAIWHAGQVIRASRSFPLTQLKGFYAIAVFHACLCFWIYSVQNRKGAGSRCGSRTMDDEVQNRPRDGSCSDASNLTSDSGAAGNSPSLESSSRDGVPGVFLDGEETIDLRMFLQTGYGRPLLHIGNAAEEVGDPDIIPRLVQAVFRNNYPSTSHPLPPLLENLASMAQGFNQAQVT